MLLLKSLVQLLLTIGLGACSVLITEAQEIMAVNQVTVLSKDSSLISVDAAGAESEREVPVDASAEHPVVVVSRAGPGGRIEVSGGTSAEMIITEAVTARLEPGTQIEVPKIEEGQKPTASLKLLEGKMFIKVDAEKLKKDGNVEFRLETPKSLLAVKGTKFVAASGEEADTVALFEGSVAVRDMATKAFVTLRPGQATDVSGAGGLAVRPFTKVESAYNEEFDRRELVFVPYRIDRDTISTSKTSILPPGKDRADSGNWIEMPELFKAKPVKFDGFPFNGVRADYVPGEPYEELFLDLQFKPDRLKVAPEKIIGALVTGRTSGPFRPFVKVNLPCTETAASGITVMIESDDPEWRQGEWKTYFQATQHMEAGSPTTLETWKRAEGVQVYTNSSSWPTKEPAPRLSVEIASIQIVTLGGDEK